MADNSRKQQADAQFRTVQRAQDGKKAMAEYETDAAAVRGKTARLRELRLARDAAEQAAAATAAAPAKKSAKKAKRTAAMLSDWLKDRDGSGRNS